MKSSSPSRARWAVGATFLVCGILVGAWIPHVPLAKERLDVGPGLFGLALLAIAAGAVCAMPVAGVLINRYGSARMSVITGSLFCVTFLGPIFAPGLASFMVAGFAMGMMIGSMDVSMNAHGIAVEKLLRRPTMSMFHGLYSVGALIGAFAGAAILEAYGEAVQALSAALLCIVIQLGVAGSFLHSSADKGLSGTHFAWPTRATIGLGLLCFLALMIEGSVMDWAAILLREKFLIEAGTAALGFGFYQVGMAIARLSGDWIRLRMGAVKMVTASALLTAAGTGLALIAPSPALAIAALTFAGLGVGNIAPVLFAGGGRLEPSAPGVASRR